jgi:hypothetical protein
MSYMTPFGNKCDTIQKLTPLDYCVCFPMFLKKTEITLSKFLFLIGEGTAMIELVGGPRARPPMEENFLIFLIEK